MYKPLKFDNIKEFTWTRIAKELSRMTGTRIELSESSGTVTFSEEGIDIRWSYNEPSQKLSLNCTRKPDNMGYDKIYDRLREIVQSKIVTL